MWVWRRNIPRRSRRSSTFSAVSWLASHISTRNSRRMSTTWGSATRPSIARWAGGFEMQPMDIAWLAPKPRAKSQKPAARSPSLKPEPRRQLDIARAPAAQERIARAHVGRGRHRQEACATSGAVKPVLCKVHAEGRPQWIGKVGVVDQVIEVRAKLQRQPLRQSCVLGQAEVEVPVIRTHKGVAAKVAEVLIPGATDRYRIEGARHAEGRQVE